MDTLALREMTVERDTDVEKDGEPEDDGDPLGDVDVTKLTDATLDGAALCDTRALNVSIVADAECVSTERDAEDVCDVDADVDPPTVALNDDSTESDGAADEVNSRLTLLAEDIDGLSDERAETDVETVSLEDRDGDDVDVTTGDAVDDKVLHAFDWDGDVVAERDGAFDCDTCALLEAHAEKNPDCETRALPEENADADGNEVNEGDDVDDALKEAVRVESELVVERTDAVVAIVLDAENVSPMVRVGGAVVDTVAVVVDDELEVVVEEEDIVVVGDGVEAIVVVAVEFVEIDAIEVSVGVTDGDDERVALADEINDVVR